MLGRRSVGSFFGALALVVSAAFVAPRSAHAVELYWDPVTNAWVRTPTPVRIVTTPIQNPTRYWVVSNPPPITRVHVQVRQMPPPTTTVVVDPGPTEPERDPYDTHGLVVAGAGLGGLLFFGDGLTSVAMSYRLHLGLAVGPAEFAVRADLVPDAGQVPVATGGTSPSALYAVGASFNYRFLERAVVHPVFGIGLESIILDPHVGSTGTAFGAVGRAGLELAYPLADGALALGIDFTGHLPFAATDQYAGDLVAMLGMGAYVDYRF